MKDIQLFGLGNGLVDIQYEVEETELAELGLKKGEMRLVESEKQRGLLEKYSHRKFNRCSGGAAANTIICFSQLGGKAAYSTVLGKDEFGQFYANEFIELGIELKAEMLDNYPTGTCFVFITPDSERTMHTSLGATAFFGKHNIDETIISRSQWIYAEGYKFTAQSSTEALFYSVELAKKHGTKVSLTFSDVFIIDSFRENLQKVVNQSDLIFCNENEAICYTGKQNVEDAVEALSRECPNVVVTLGGNGSIVKWEGNIYRIPSYPARPVDTTGAGDCFAGGFMYGIITTGNPVIAGHIASAVGARVVSQMGARISGDIKELRDEILSKVK